MPSGRSPPPGFGISTLRRIRASDLTVYLEVREAGKQEARVEMDKLLSRFKQLVR